MLPAPFFSIITVSYNNSSTIAQTIDSVLSQDFKDFEYWVIDGGSSDGTQQILAQYNDQIRWISEPDEGIYHAMNKGWTRANGRFIAFLNADDFYAHTRVLSDVAGMLELNPQAWASYSDLAYVDPVDTQKIHRYWRAGTYDIRSFYYGWMPPHPTFFLKKEAFERFGGFRQDELKSAADYELILRMLCKHQLPAVYCPGLIVRMRSGGESNRSLKNRVRGNNEDRLAWKLNQMEPYWFTLFLKPLRKITQFFARP